jgi:dihydroorotate dehydrogenase (fumarate)
VVKQLLAGAKAVQLCSVLLKQGLSSVAKMEKELSDWMDLHDYSSIPDFNGKLAQEKMPDPAKWERVQYMKSILEAQKG